MECDTPVDATINGFAFCPYIQVHPFPGMLSIHMSPSNTDLLLIGKGLADAWDLGSNSLAFVFFTDKKEEERLIDLFLNRSEQASE